MTYLATWPQVNESPLFMPSVLKRAGEYQTSYDLEAQYGFMTDEGERALRHQMQALGRPLTRAEQQNLNPQTNTMSGLEEISTTKLVLVLLGLILLLKFKP